MSKGFISKQPDHLILISGGLALFELLRRVAVKYGKSHVKLWFFNTLIEDEDLYRFLQDIENHFELPIERFQDGRNPWQVFYDERFIGNSRADVCSRHLKRKVLERELRRRYPGGEGVILYFGLEWSETHRINAMRPKWEDKGLKLDFPLLERSLLFPDDYISQVVNLHIRFPVSTRWDFLTTTVGVPARKRASINGSYFSNSFPTDMSGMKLWSKKSGSILGKTFRYCETGTEAGHDR